MNRGGALTGAVLRVLPRPEDADPSGHGCSGGEGSVGGGGVDGARAGMGVGLARHQRGAAGGSAPSARGNGGLAGDAFARPPNRTTPSRHRRRRRAQGIVRNLALSPQRCWALSLQHHWACCILLLSWRRSFKVKGRVCVLT